MKSEGARGCLGCGPLNSSLECLNLVGSRTQQGTSSLGRARILCLFGFAWGSVHPDFAIQKNTKQTAFTPKTQQRFRLALIVRESSQAHPASLWEHEKLEPRTSQNRKPSPQSAGGVDSRFLSQAPQTATALGFHFVLRFGIWGLTLDFQTRLKSAAWVWVWGVGVKRHWLLACCMHATPNHLRTWPGQEIHACVGMGYVTQGLGACLRVAEALAASQARFRTDSAVAKTTAPSLLASFALSALHWKSPPRYHNPVTPLQILGLVRDLAGLECGALGGFGACGCTWGSCDLPSARLQCKGFVCQFVRVCTQHTVVRMSGLPHTCPRIGSPSRRKACERGLEALRVPAPSRQRNWPTDEDGNRARVSWSLGGQAFDPVAAQGRNIHRISGITGRIPASGRKTGRSRANAE